ncbi:MAG TPA: SCO family protein, partial [Steroidobacteraceae bacterium]|nr:SCO family protein [Steroidobacteraceae bacterium]
WHLVFFGFTNCPDVCPNTLTILARVEKALADLPESQQPGVVLVSVDPTRDTPEQLGPYVRFFGERFVGITGTEENIAALTSALGVPVAKVDLEGGYTMDHGAGIFVLDPEVRVRAFFSTPHEVATIASDYRRIVSG